MYVSTIQGASTICMGHALRCEGMSKFISNVFRPSTLANYRRSRSQRHTTTGASSILASDKYLYGGADRCDATKDSIRLYVDSSISGC
jgi:hypothetical protein